MTKAQEQEQEQESVTRSPLEERVFQAFTSLETQVVKAEESKDQAKPVSDFAKVLGNVVGKPVQQPTNVFGIEEIGDDEWKVVGWALDGTPTDIAGPMTFEEANSMAFAMRTVLRTYRDDPTGSIAEPVEEDAEQAPDFIPTALDNIRRDRGCNVTFDRWEPAEQVYPGDFVGEVHVTYGDDARWSAIYGVREDGSVACYMD